MDDLESEIETSKNLDTRRLFLKPLLLNTRNGRDTEELMSCVETTFFYVEATLHALIVSFENSASVFSVRNLIVYNSQTSI